jgi:hypothetical protein
VRKLLPRRTVGLRLTALYAVLFLLSGAVLLAITAVCPERLTRAAHPLTTMRAAVDVAVAKPGPVPGQTAVLAGRLRAEPGRADELLDGLLAPARGGTACCSAAPCSHSGRSRPLNH